MTTNALSPERVVAIRTAILACATRLLVGIALPTQAALAAAAHYPVRPLSAIAANDTGALRAATAHFKFVYQPIDSAVVRTLGSALEANYLRITTDLGVGEMSPVTVHLYIDHAAMEGAVGMQLPRWVGGLATSATAIHQMSPHAPDAVPVEVITSGVIHEFVHCVSLTLNPRIGNRPRWLWESVAIYEAGPVVDPHALTFLRDSLPALTTLNAMDYGHIYDLGYTLGAFVDQRGGKEALRALILNNGDIEATLGLNAAAFHQAWGEFLKEQYGVVIPGSKP